MCIHSLCDVRLCGDFPFGDSEDATVMQKRKAGMFFVFCFCFLFAGIITKLCFVATLHLALPLHSTNVFFAFCTFLVSFFGQ